MKFICTSDWHLGNLFHGIDRLHEHEHFLQWLESAIDEKQPDALLVAGDVFDNGNPSAAAQTLYYGFLDRITHAHPHLQVVVTAGNHDSANRLEAPRPLLQRHRVEIRGTVNRQLVSADGEAPHWEPVLDDMLVPLHNADGSEEVVVMAVPYLRADIVGGESYSSGVNHLLRQLTQLAHSRYPDAPLLLMAHLYAQGAEVAERSSEKIVVGGQEQVALDCWEGHPDYFTCGHIHKRQPIWGVPWARYSGSVLPMSFAERDYSHGVDLVVIEPETKPSVEFLEYHPQHQLQSLPAEGAAELGELLELIAELPPRLEGKLTNSCLYLELKVSLALNNVLAEPNDENAKGRKGGTRSASEMQKAIDEALADRDAVACRMERVSPVPDVDAIMGRHHFESVQAVLERDPIEAIAESYAIRYGEEAQMGAKQREALLTIIEQARKEIQ